MTPAEQFAIWREDTVAQLAVALQTEADAAANLTAAETERDKTLADHAALRSEVGRLETPAYDAKWGRSVPTVVATPLRRLLAEAAETVRQAEAMVVRRGFPLAEARRVVEELRDALRQLDALEQPRAEEAA